MYIISECLWTLNILGVALLSFDESVTHALLTCEEVKRWWFVSLLAFRIDIRDDSHFMEGSGICCILEMTRLLQRYVNCYPI